MKERFKRQKLYLYRDRLICLFFSLLLLSILEIISRLVYFQFDEDKIGQIVRILEQDPVLFWRQKANLSVIFQNTRVQTNSLGLRNRNFELKKDKNTLRIVCLGASPTFGWGVEAEDAYPYQLEKLLREKYKPQSQIEVINAGVIGYTSYQGSIFLKKEIVNFLPDVITVPFVINDVDKHRFYRSNDKSDKELGPKSEILVSIENLLNKSNLFNVLRQIIIHRKGVSVRYFAEGSYSEKRRISLEDYKSNLNAIIDMAKKNNIKVLLIKMPVNLPLPQEIPELLQAKVDIYITNATTYAESGKYDQAIVELKKAIKYNSYSSKAFYYLGIYSEKKKKFNEAKDYFQEAKEMELFECGRLGKIYNEAMQRVASEREIPLVDIVSAFDAFSKKSREYLFLDSTHDIIHPNVTAHKIISEHLCNALIKEL